MQPKKIRKQKAKIDGDVPFKKKNNNKGKKKRLMEMYLWGSTPRALKVLMARAIMADAIWRTCLDG